ncbi:hypothetical protein CHS0354_013706 [Potamilus streckersoni]|uniref:Bcl-2 Bcl-2 homology region 1-3 domain-containing protein n=1 Tax=Potamilus streckersoni TaxID=2493646 RepID=A0AAE0SY80_9BIVA|nr:hypothetical protein CHS0354_013706 [Potamilus streckersoni]
MSVTDHPLAMGRRRSKRQMSYDDIGNQGRVLLNEFISDRMKNEGLQSVPAIEELTEPGTPSGPPLGAIHEVGRALRCIADELDQDQKLQRMINQVSPDATHDTFLRVANEIFSDGVISWGRIVTLFYFGYKMTVKAIDKLPLIKAIINWVINFIVDKVAPWIIDKGGWEAIREYFGTPKGQVIAIFTTGFLVCVGIYLYHSTG